MVEIPFIPNEKYAQKDVYLRLDEKQAGYLRAVLEGLETQCATLASGRAVTNSQTAMIWILEQAAS